jgi:hypothetical protein
MDRFLSRYAALCVLSLFLGIQYDIGVVLRPFDALVVAGGLILVGRASQLIETTGETGCSYSYDSVDRISTG